MISISKIVSDRTNGNVIIKELGTSDLSSKTARVSRTTTLDGGVYINHSGFTDGDRTLKIKAVINQTQADILNNIFQYQMFVIVSILDGVFLAAIESYNNKSGQANLIILIKEKLNI